MIKTYLIVCLQITIFSAALSQPDGIVKNYEVTIDVNAHKLVKRETLLIQINNSDGNWISDVAIYHSPDEKYHLEEAVILDADFERVRKIKSRDIHTEHAGSRVSFFDDRLVDRFSMKHNNYPYFIKYSYTIERKEFFFIDGWSPIIDYDLSTEKSSLTLTRPDNYEVLIDTTGAFEYSSTTDGNTVIEKWEIDNATAPIRESYAPERSEELMRIEILPKEFYYGVDGINGQWHSFGKWAWNLSRDKDLLNPAHSTYIQKKFGHISDTLDLIKALYYYLQDNTRYISVAVGHGGLEPYSADYVATNKYGDCKALTIYMKSLLKVFGIKSYYTKVNAGENAARVDPGFPGQQFNHIILCIPFRQDTIWLENTSNCSPFNYLGSFTQNRYVLPTQALNSQLITTPELTNNMTAASYDLKLSENNVLSGSVKMQFLNAAHEDFAYIIRNYSAKEQTDYTRDYLNDLKLHMEEFSLTHENRDLPENNLDASVSTKRLTRKVGNLQLIGLPPVQLPTPGAFKSRTRPVRFPLSKSYSDTISIEIQNQRIESLPSATSIESEFGQYQCSVSLQNDHIVIHRSYHLNSGDYELSQIGAIHDFLAQVRDFENNAQIILKPNQ